MAVVPSAKTESLREHSQLINEMSAGETIVESGSGVSIFHLAGVEIHSIADPSRMHAHFIGKIREFEPTWILVSSEDPGQILLEAALKESPSRIVYLAHTPAMLPFGPDCFFANPARCDLLRQVAGVLSVSRYVKDYLWRWGGIDSDAITFPNFGRGPFPNFGDFDRAFVTMINPCAVKGIIIFLELAKNLPHVDFAVVPTWGTTKEDFLALNQLPNVRILQPVKDIDKIFAQSRVLLVPSLWNEAFGTVVTEAMLRGIPALASNVGGLAETKLGVDYLLPVNPIERYEEVFDEKGTTFIPKIPPQEIEPWLQSLSEILSSRARYESLSSASRDAALKFVSTLSIEPFENYLGRLSAKHQVSANDKQGKDALSKAHHPSPTLSGLSPEKRALLALKLSKKGQTPDGTPLEKAPND